MRTVSSTAHVPLTATVDDVLVMEIVDPTLPAVAHLAGASARDVLSAAVAAVGGTIHDCRVVQLQYRPGHDLVARYRCDISWADRDRRSETLLASTTRGEPLPGTIPVHAHVDGRDLAVSVWRWPFDPVLAGLATAVTPDRLRPVLAAAGVPTTGRTEIDIVAYRPTERAVVRVTTGGRVDYVKVVGPDSVAALADRHRWLLGAGLPVPEVVACDETLGLLGLAELPGPTLRDRIKGRCGAFPDPAQVLSLGDRLRALPPPPAPCSLRPTPDRLRDALGHAELLRAVAAVSGSVLDRVAARVDERLVDRRPGAAVVHGDLHEAQLIVADDGLITGLLDVDDVGVGDPVTDAATLIAHLRFRAALAADISMAVEIGEYADALRRAAASRFALEELDVWTAAVLVGLATGPFRIRRPSWRDEVDAVLGEAAGLVEGT